MHVVMYTSSNMILLVSIYDSPAGIEMDSNGNDNNHQPKDARAINMVGEEDTSYWTRVDESGRECSVLNVTVHARYIPSKEKRSGRIDGENEKCCLVLGIRAVIRTLCSIPGRLV